jgi:hypothetical protein
MKSTGEAVNQTLDRITRSCWPNCQLYKTRGTFFDVSGNLMTELNVYRVGGQRAPEVVSTQPKPAAFLIIRHWGEM